MANAWWVKRGQKYIDVDTKHINTVLEHPESFGLTRESILDIYNEFGEKPGQEGDAREKIILELVKEGWLRVRHYTRPQDYWTFTVNSFRGQTPDIAKFCNWAIGAGTMSERDSMMVASLRDNQTYRYDFMNGGVGKFLNEKKQRDADRKTKFLERILNVCRKYS
jgi:hypothetical protein